MHGNLEPDEDIMNDVLISKRKSAAVMKALHDQIKDTIATLGWDCYDDVVVEIGGMSVSGIDGLGTKWSPKLGDTKYNKDAFIVIKNLSRTPFVQSNPDPNLKAHHDA